MTDLPSDKPPTRMDPEVAQFFGPVGYAITRWAHVDSYLFNFCRFALTTSDEKAAIVFYRSQGLKDHLMLTDSLMRLSLSQRQTHQWSAIFSLADKLLPFRNNLAHNHAAQVVHIHVTGDAGAFSPHRLDRWWELRTDETKLLNKKKKAARAKAADIIQHIMDVHQLLDLMNELTKALPKRPHKQRAPSLKRQSPQASGSKKKSARAAAKRQSPPRSSRA